MRASEHHQRPARPPGPVSAPFSKMILLPEAKSAPNLLLVARSPGMRGFRKQRTTPDAGYGHLGFPRANTTELNPTLTTAGPMARMTGRDTRPDPLGAGERTGRRPRSCCCCCCWAPSGPRLPPPTTPPPFPDSRPPPSQRSGSRWSARSEARPNDLDARSADGNHQAAGNGGTATRTTKPQPQAPAPHRPHPGRPTRARARHREAPPQTSLPTSASPLLRAPALSPALSLRVRQQHRSSSGPFVVFSGVRGTASWSRRSPAPWRGPADRPRPCRRCRRSLPSRSPQPPPWLRPRPQGPP